MFQNGFRGTYIVLMIVIFLQMMKQGKGVLLVKALSMVFWKWASLDLQKKAIPTFTALDNLEPSLWPNIV